MAKLAKMLSKVHSMPIPLMPPDAQDRLEVVMKAIDKWFEHQELLKLLYPIASKGQLLKETTKITLTSTQERARHPTTVQPKKLQNANTQPSRVEQRGSMESQSPSPNKRHSKQGKLIPQTTTLLQFAR